AGFRDADAGVCYGDGQVVLYFFKFDCYTSGVGDELDGVIEQVIVDAFEGGGVGYYFGYRPGDYWFYGDLAGAAAGFDFGNDIMQGGEGVYGVWSSVYHAAGFDFCDLEDVVYHVL